MTYPIIDIGANLTHSSFREDLTDVLIRAKQQGVETLIITGASEEGSEAALKLAIEYDAENNATYPRLYSTAGTHPHEATTFTKDSLSLFKKLSHHEKLVALGECGLDFNRNYSPHDVQEYCFEAQLELACELQKPVFLHERDAHDHFIKILQRYINDLPNAVVHCFTGVQSQLEAYLEIGCHIGITGWICDERRGHHLKEFIQLVPADKLMIETDAPYLLPRDLKPKPTDRRNEPSYLPHILETVAHSIGKPAEQVAKETFATTSQFFNLNCA